MPSINFPIESDNTDAVLAINPIGRELSIIIASLWFSSNFISFDPVCEKAPCHINQKPLKIEDFWRCPAPWD
jgi:hypothetical protein